MRFPSLLFAYLSPDTFLPATSIVATITGLVLMFGRRAFYLVRRGLVRVFLRPARAELTNRPHFQVTEREQFQSARR